MHPPTSAYLHLEDLQRGAEPGLEEDVQDLGLLLGGVVFEQPRAAAPTAESADAVELSRDSSAVGSSVADAARH